MEGNSEWLIDKLVDLFPNGPPSEGLRDIAIQSTLPTSRQIVQVDNDSQYRVVMPIGTEISGVRRGRNKWEVKVSSPKSPNGYQVNWAQVVDGGKEHMMVAIATVAGDMLEIKTRLRSVLHQYQDSDPHELSPSLGPIMQTYQSLDELVFDSFYQEIGKQIEKDPPQILNLDFLGLSVSGGDLSSGITSSVLTSDSPVEIALLTAIAIHEAWRSKADAKFLEDLEMAKNNGNKSWWKFTGSHPNINKVINALTHNRHYLVLDTKESVYLHIQDDETKFVEGLTKSNSCRCTRVDEPEYGEALCGKRSTNVGVHSRACGGCARIRKNGKQQAEHTNDVEDAADAAQGNMISVLAPWADRDENDYQGFAIDYRRCADEFLKLAEHHSQIADYYESLSSDGPSDAVAQAEELLAQARRDEKAERTRKLTALTELKSSDPLA